MLRVKGKNDLITILRKREDSCCIISNWNLCKGTSYAGTICYVIGFFSLMIQTRLFLFRGDRVINACLLGLASGCGVSNGISNGGSGGGSGSGGGRRGGSAYGIVDALVALTIWHIEWLHDECASNIREWVCPASISKGLWNEEGCGHSLNRSCGRSNCKPFRCRIVIEVIYHDISAMRNNSSPNVGACLVIYIEVPLLVLFIGCDVETVHFVADINSILFSIIIELG